MFEILAAAQTAQTTVPVSQEMTQIYGPAVAILVALGGWKGIAQGILWLQGRNGNGHSRKYVPQSECNLRHEKDNQMTGTLVKSIDKLEVAVTRLHERIDEIGSDRRK
ncbi:MAG: hypothetical protein EHM35_02855 [Planctomycetaceae bacterium]|nr:MAG: hypothetical protein EHM35_02855 [Planctomycetaceae bacterium]